MARFLGTLLGLAAVQAAAVVESQQEQSRENPIRRIVNLLQQMAKGVAEEGERDKDMHEKFVCYCEKNDGELAASLQGLRDKVPQLEATIKETEGKKAQLDADLAQHKQDRTDAKAAIASATKQREKEAATFGEESTELKANIAALKKAITAIVNGMAGSFLQSDAAGTLRALVVNAESLDRAQRGELMDFLQQQYAPASGEIVGILKQLLENMEGELDDATKEENTAIAEFEGLVAAKEKEIQAATEAIESKLERTGQTAVEIVNFKNDLDDTKDQLGEDETFLMELKKSCATKKAEFEERTAMRAQEAVAIQETIKILNDDDALDLFKKTLPSPSLLQVTTSTRTLRMEALSVLKKALDTDHTPQASFLELAIMGKKVSFEKVIKMIDDMVVNLGAEQKDDESQRDWCNTEFDQSDDKQQELKRRIEGRDAQIAETSEAIAQLKDELAALAQGIKDLDAAVTEATSQRQAEHKDFVETAAQNNAAVQLLGVAKNRLNKFYNPALYMAPQRRELTEEERIYVNSGGVDPRDAEEAAAANTGIAGTGITVFNQGAPPPPPETAGAYKKKDAGGPTALIDKLKNDLEKDMQANEMDEKQSQKEYEEMMGESAKKRAADSKAITEKDSQKADLEGDLHAAKTAKKERTVELVTLGEYISQLHGSCDFLLQNFDLRKEARANEIDALKKAKAVLSGADYSFTQTGSFLERRQQ
jgi:septal ring factor EnvC (AmiA/AmiB activator)